MNKNIVSANKWKYKRIVQYLSLIVLFAAL